MTTRIAIVLSFAAACSGHHEPRPVARTSSATQADLARELDDADRRGTYAAVKQRWQGLALHWTVTRQRLLCGSPESCHVAAFPVARPAKHGWMPALAFAPGEFAKVQAACGAADQCELEVEGTLAELVVSPELPTSLRFSDVKVMRAHAT